jgi:GNAT superfamily N-acetyltransferase
MEESMIRFALSSDAPEIFRLIKELAAYEREPDAVTTTAERIRDQMLWSAPPFECILSVVDEKVVGFALYFQSYSTWQGEPGLYLEDFYVMEEYRGRGLGRELWEMLGHVCKVRNYTRLEWQVLQWNELAIRFYKSFGGEPLGDWIKYRLSGDALEKL